MEPPPTQKLRRTQRGLAQFRPEDDQPVAEASIILIMFYVYFLESLRNGKVYVGQTSKLPAIRLEEHNNSSNQWTKNNKPFNLIYYESYCCEEDSKLREKFYKMGFGKLIKKVIIETLHKKSNPGIGAIG